MSAPAAPAAPEPVVTFHDVRVARGGRSMDLTGDVDGRPFSRRLRLEASSTPGENEAIIGALSRLVTP